MATCPFSVRRVIKMASVQNVFPKAWQWVKFLKSALKHFYQVSSVLEIVILISCILLMLLQNSGIKMDYSRWFSDN